MPVGIYIRIVHQPVYEDNITVTYAPTFLYLYIRGGTKKQQGQMLVGHVHPWHPLNLQLTSTFMYTVHIHT